MAPHSSRAQPTKDELDMLEAMMDKMDGSRPSSSGGFPPRTTSRASSHSHLSHQSSNRSLHSLNSTHAAPGSSNDPRKVRSPSALSDLYSSRHDFDDDATPSISQGEWGRTRTVPAQTYDDNSSIERAVSPNVYRSSSAHYPSYSRSMPASPRSRSRPTPSPLPDTGSPLRLLPRSPVNNRTPLEDLTFFREFGALADERPWGSSSSHADADADSLSIRSGHSSVLSGGSGALRASNLRAARLREDIEKEAQRIKERASMEEMGRNAEAASAVAAGHRAIMPDPPRTSPPVDPPTPAPAPTLSSRQSPDGRRDVQSGIPLFPGAPSPAPSPSIPREDDTRSIRSVGSSVATGPWSSSHGREGTSHSGSASFSGSGMSGSASASARTEYGLEGGSGGRDRERRTRQKESREWSQTCWVWQREIKASGVGGMSGSGSVGGFAAMGGKFSKAPLIRDVPAALKRKSNKRESAHHLLSPAEALLFNVEGSKSGGSKSSSSKEKEKDKSKEKGKDKAPAGPAAASRDGRWRRATGVLRDDGFFRVFADSDKTVVNSVHLPSLNRTDVHLVDHSLFGRPNCISIARPAVSPSTPRRASFLPSSSSSTALNRSDDSVYLCFPSIIATQVWLVMAHCFAQPEFYLPSGAATPRPFRSSTARRGGPSGFPTSSDSGSDSEPDGKADELESSCRIFRSLQVSINEGRALGELATEIVRPGPKASWEHPSPDDVDLTTSSFDSSSLGPEASPAKSVSSMAMPRLHSRASHDSRGGGGDGSSSSSEVFCEIEMGGEVVAQTAVRKGTSPFWNETFVFSDLPPLVSPIVIRVLQSSSKHPTKTLLVGTATVRVPDLPRQQIVEDWWAVKPANPTKSSDAVGELSLSLKINEEVVLPSRDYQEILNLLTDDPEADLASEIAHEFPADLEEVTRILLRVYSAKSLLLPRVQRLADLEIDSNARNNRSAAILFRGNTILTKTIELYLRLIGAEYLDASIGNVIRRICADEVEIEIDPMKVKPGTKDKDLLANTHALHEWTLTLWNSIYDAREKCPHDLRQIFNHIQTVVVEKYGQSDDQKNTRWTCVSAFIFLRFFVPAVLNPKLFFIVSNPPDPKAKRTLTLVAKTLQGLANFSSFGQKEPWMLPMNAFVRENHAALLDFLEHVSTPGSSAVLRQEWTSPNAPAYLAPYRLRSSLSPLAQEGVPLLPHLVDLPRELGALAARVARLAAEKGPIVEGSIAHFNDRCETPSIASSRGGRSRQFVDFADACLDVYSESRRRGGGLVPAAQYPDVRMKTPDPKVRAKRAMTGRPPTASSSVSTAGLRRSLGLGGTDRNARAESTGSEDLYIRKPASQTVEPDVEAVGTDLARTHVRDVSVESSDSVMSRRNHRAFTINGAGAGGIRGVSQGGAPKSFSTEDLSLLASLRSSSSDDIRERAVSPSPLPTSVTLTSLSGYANQPSRPSFEGSQVYTSRSIPAASILAPSEYAFPPNRSPKPSATPSAALSTSASTRTSSTSRSSQLASPVAAPTSRIRITQETTTTTSYVPSATAALSLVNGDSPVPVDDDFSLSPTSHEDGTPFESSFSGFSAPLMHAQTSQTSAHSVLTVLSGRSLTASSSSVSISAEVSAGAAGSRGGASGLSGRRASTAGFSSFGLGGGGSRRGGPGDRGSGTISGVMRDDESEGGSSRASSGKGGLLSRAMGRKGSRAS